MSRTPAQKVPPHAFAAQDRADPTDISGTIGIGQDAQLVLDGEGPPARTSRQFGRRSGRRRHDRRPAASVRAVRRQMTDWLRSLLQRKPRKLAAVALANKMARMAWAMMTSGEAYRRPPAAAGAVPA